jgi:hypothetical protein
MHLKKQLICFLSGAALIALVSSPSVYAQAPAGGTGTSTTSGTSVGSAAGGTSALGNSGSSVTSPSTLGGSVSGSQPAVPGSTAGDAAVNANNPPVATPPAGAPPGVASPANQAVQQRSNQGTNQ